MGHTAHFVLISERERMRFRGVGLERAPPRPTNCTIKPNTANFSFSTSQTPTVKTSTLTGKGLQLRADVQKSDWLNGRKILNNLAALKICFVWRSGMWFNFGADYLRQNMMNQTISPSLGLQLAHLSFPVYNDNNTDTKNKPILMNSIFGKQNRDDMTKGHTLCGPLSDKKNYFEEEYYFRSTESGIVK